MGSPEGLTPAEAQRWAAAFDADFAGGSPRAGWTATDASTGEGSEEQWRRSRRAAGDGGGGERGPGGGDVATFGWTDKGGTAEQTVNGDVRAAPGPEPRTAGPASRLVLHPDILTPAAS